MKLYFETNISLPYTAVKDKFNKELFLYLAPPIIPFNLKKFDGCKKGDVVQIDLGIWPLVQQWVSLITFDEESEKGWSFIDEGEKLPWPLKEWKHHHRVDRISEKECRIVDDIHFSCRPSFLNPIMKPFLFVMFSIRPRRYRKFFQGSL
jgi:ligand-binding SRPBCC domain-containing protein